MVTESRTKISRVYNYDGGSTDPNSYIDTSGTPTISRLSSTRSRTHDGPVYNYKKRIAAIQSATSTFLGSRNEIEFRPGYARTGARNFSPSLSFVQYETTGPMCDTGPSPNFTVAITLADNRAKADFISAIRGANTSLQGGIVAGEIGETLRMLKSPAQALRHGVNDYFSTLKKRRTRSPRQNRRVLSETWLEYSFGWKPFMSDIRDASEALQKLKYGYIANVVRGFGIDEILMSDTFTNDGYAALSWRYRTKTWTEAIVVYRGAVKAPIGDRKVIPSRLFGFSLDNFVPTVWELIPYSFLVDYFTNIGDVLSAWSMWDLNLAWKNRTILTKVLKESQTIYLAPRSSTQTLKVDFHYMRPGWSKATRSSVTRSNHIGDLIPTFQVEIPGMSSLKWLNLAALARTRRSLIPYR